MNTVAKLSLLILVAALAAAADGLMVYTVKMFSGQTSAVASPAGGDVLTKSVPPQKNEPVQNEGIRRAPSDAPTAENPMPAGTTGPKDPSKGPTAETPPSPASASRETSPAAIVGNRDSKRYHLPGMAFYNRVEAYHRVEFRSEEDAIKAGYRKAAK